MMSRKIDRINDLAVLPGDGGEVLVGENVGVYGRNVGVYGKKMREFTGKWGTKLGFETRQSCWPAVDTVRVTIFNQLLQTQLTL